ncbi:hypothetical protein ACQHIV_20410 [Kribbella sp. GL6]|uniref:hypothetical protein n=1 Tax=Kribbella sp. GL6 TaxID=3419765 RepID=UPI003D02959D
MSYTPELRERMHQDDTLARLRYLSDSPAEPPASANASDGPAPTEDHPDADPTPPAVPPTDGDEPARTDDRADQVDERSAPPTSTVGDISDQVPSKLREQMLQDSVFTRLSWADDVQPLEAAAPGDETEAADDRRPANSPDAAHITDLVAAHDKTWDSSAAGLPPGALPESTKSLSAAVIDAMDPDIRRILEYQGAAEYIAANKTDRPWLEPAAEASEPVQRIFTAIDQGNGHAHIRHGPMGDDQMYADRVARLEDPAQTDPSKRALSIDGLNENKQHYCAKESSRIHDVEAFVAVFAGAVKHPDVRQALALPWAEDREPRPVAIPIADLLGEDGHEACSGYRLAGSEARRVRKEWVKARAEGRDLTDTPEPEAERIPTFEGGMIIVRFAGNAAAKRYEIITLFPKPLAES